MSIAMTPSRYATFEDMYVADVEAERYHAAAKVAARLAEAYIPANHESNRQARAVRDEYRQASINYALLALLNQRSPR